MDSTTIMFPLRGERETNVRSQKRLRHYEEYPVTGNSCDSLPGLVQE